MENLLTEGQPWAAAGQKMDPTQFIPPDYLSYLSKKKTYVLLWQECRDDVEKQKDQIPGALASG